MAFPELNQILILLINIFGILLGVVVFRENPKIATNRLFAVMIVLMLLWVNFAYLPRVLGPSQEVLAFLLLKIAWFVTPLFFALLYFFAAYLVGLQRSYRRLHASIATLGSLAALATGFTDVVVREIQFVDGSAVRILYGDAMWPFLVIITAIIGATTFITYRGLSLVGDKQKLQLQYFAFGLAIFYATNFVFNITLPIFLDIVRWYWIGDYSTLAVLGFTGYAIVRRELFGVRVVLTAFLVVLIGTLLAADIIAFTDEILVKVAKAISLLVFLYFGYWLIQSVQREIRQRKELAEAYEKLKELDEAKSEFISIASHQLRTPLTAIKGYISMIMEGTYGKLGKKQEKPMENVYDSNERLIRLVNDLLSISRIESGKIQVEWQKAKIEDVANSVVDEIQIKAKEKGLKLVFQKPKLPLPAFRMDPAKVRNIILNILDNAIRYTARGSITLSITTKPANRNLATGGVVISVKDTGEGMSKEEIEHLFESFSRGKAGTKIWTEGAGFGLYIAKQFVEMHKGKIWAESPGKGKGSTFYVQLPVT